MSLCLSLLLLPGEASAQAVPAQQSPSAMNPAISVIADFAAAGFSDVERSQAEARQTGGHDPTANGFNLQQVELSLGSSVDPYFRFDSNIVFSLFGVEVEEAYGTTLALPGRTQLRVGQFLTRFGRANPTHPHSWAFVDQPFPLGRVFGGEGNRGLGLEGSVLLPLPWSVELLVSETMAAGEASARSFFGAEDLGVEGPLDLQTTAALKQFFPFGPDWSLSWGLSYANGPNSSGRQNRTEVYGTDLYLRWYPASRASNQELSLTTEWFWRRRQVPLDVLADWSGYSQLAWQFSQRWAVAGRHEYGGPASSEGDLVDPLDPSWTVDRHRGSANLSFWPTEFSRIRLQGSADLAGWDDEPLYAGFLAVEFVTGAHGAHAF